MFSFDFVSEDWFKKRILRLTLKLQKNLTFYIDKMVNSDKRLNVFFLNMFLRNNVYNIHKSII